MESLQLPIKCLKTQFEDFHLIKPNLLSLLNTEDSYPNLSEVDWGQSSDFNRPWVKYILPHLSYNLTNLVKSQNYSNIILENIWYQRYQQSNHHTWHIHSGHYTGVFYVEHPEGSPLTQLSFNDKVIDLKASEGDIIIFPSLVVHRSPKNQSNNPKTIISFNLNIDMDDIDFPK